MQNTKIKYYSIIGIDPEGNEVSLQIPLDSESDWVMNQIKWYFENGWILKGSVGN